MSTAAHSRLMELLQLSARLIMENGGEIYRVEETVTRMGAAAGAQQVDCFAVPSGVFISVKWEDGAAEASVTRIRRGGTSLWRVNDVIAVSRALVAGNLNVQTALDKLQALRDARPPFPAWMVVCAAFICGASFTMMFGGNWMDVLTSGVITALAHMVCLLMERREPKPHVTVLTGSFLTGFLTGLAALHFPLTQDVIIAGALMPFLPGLAMTNAVSDLIRGDILSGISHGFSAILTAGMIALGTITSAALLTLIRGGVL